MGDAFTFLLFAVLSRAYGQEGIGEYSFAIAFTGFFAVFVDFGLGLYLIKELSRRDESLGQHYGPIFSLRLALAAAAFGVLLLTLPFLPFPHESKLIIATVGAFQVMVQVATALTVVFMAREDTHLTGILEAVSKIVAALAAIGVVLAGGTLLMALVTLPVVTLGQVCAAYWLASRKYGPPRLVVSIPPLMELARKALPYAQSTFLLQICHRVDVVCLGFFLGAASAGVYNVAYRVVFLLLFIPHFATIIQVPRASRLFVASREELVPLYHQAFKTSILMGLPLAAGLWVIAPDLIELIFGGEFAASAFILRLLAWLLLLSFLSLTASLFLVSTDRQEEVVRVQWVTALVSLVGNLVLIPTLGIIGAAIATLFSEALLLFLLMLRLRTELGWPRIGSRLAISGIGTASFVVPFLLLPVASMAVVVPSSVLLYSATLVLFKETRKNEVCFLVSMLRRQPKLS